jgi:hypothetical protein
MKRCVLIHIGAKRISQVLGISSRLKLSVLLTNTTTAKEKTSSPLHALVATLEKELTTYATKVEKKQAILETTLQKSNHQEDKHT